MKLGVQLNSFATGGVFPCRIGRSWKTSTVPASKDSTTHSAG